MYIFVVSPSIKNATNRNKGNSPRSCGLSHFLLVLGEISTNRPGASFSPELYSNWFVYRLKALAICILSFVSYIFAKTLSIMKKSIGILFSFLFLLLSFSCKDETTGTGQLDPTAMINIRPVESLGSLKAPFFMRVPKYPSSTHLSPREIVLQTTNLEFMYNGTEWGRGFSMPQRDTISPMLKMWGTDIISMNGTLDPMFIEASDCVLQRLFYVKFSTKDTVLYDPIAIYPSEGDYDKVLFDTIAYIPNSVLRSAETSIKAAYDRNDFASCYQIFDSAYVFIPITGPEWRALKANGNQ